MNGQQHQQPLETVLAQMALRLRGFVMKVGMPDGVYDGEEDDNDNYNVDDGDEVEERTLWRRVRTLVEFGLAADVRLVQWLSEMNQRLLDGGGPSRAKVIKTIADRLQWVALRLSLRSLPPICSPRIHRIQSLDKCSSPDTSSIAFQSEAEVTARMDIAGGWTDTPPITYQCASPPAVLNLSIKVNGKRPIRCRCARLEAFGGVFYTQTSNGNTERTLHFASANSVFACCAQPSKLGSLISSILIVAGIVREELIGGERIRQFAMTGPGRGLYVSANSDLPHGSGLGTSSILSGAMLAALWRLFGKSFQQSELIHAVLRVEQLHTTGGGWQDQIGGCAPGGFKLGTVCPGGKRECQWRAVPIGNSLQNEMSKRLALIYTGQTRLAKHLLEEVLLSWLGRDQRILRAVQRLSDGARGAEKALLEGKFPSDICREYNALKKEFTAGTMPSKVAELSRELTAEGLAEAAWMAGAGGGGFLYVWLREHRTLEELECFLAGDKRWHGMGVWRAEMEVAEPMTLRRGWTLPVNEFNRL
uniref:GHMP kinase N-terminal domain-containing protein n=1 Tax=Globodera rostochiensis TaxID=31243 RepID=A0A914GZ23_GLORO